MSFKKWWAPVASSGLLALTMAGGCSSSNNNNNNGGGQDAATDTGSIHHIDSGGPGNSDDASSGTDGSTTGPMYDGTTGKACVSNADCAGAGGPGVNKCTSQPIFNGGPLYPTPICIQPTCDPGTDMLIHYCDGPDMPTSPGVCLPTTSPPQTGKGVCLPQCQFTADGSMAMGCQGKDVCNLFGWGTDQAGAAVGIGYCFGGCKADGDCPTGSSCQLDQGLCLKTKTTPTKTVGAACTPADNTSNACNCLASTTSGMGYCTSFCIVGDTTATCPAGYTCDTQEPLTVTGADGGTTPGWAHQTTGMAGSCVATCPDAGACPTNSTCKSTTAPGPDCWP